MRHGISAVSTAGAVDVCAAVHDGRLRLRVRDDGPGLGDGGRTARAGSGTGLRNTRERLAQLYGAGAELHVESPPGGGTVVTIDIREAARG